MRNWGETTPKNMELKLPLMTGDGAHLVPPFDHFIRESAEDQIVTAASFAEAIDSTHSTKLFGEWIKHPRNGSQTKILIPKKVLGKRFEKSSRWFECLL